MSTFTDEQGRVFTMDPLTGGYTQVGSASQEQVSAGGGRSFESRARNARRKVQVAAGRGSQAAQEFLGKYGRGAVFAAGAIPAVTESFGELQEGRPLGAVAALAPAGLTAAGTALLGKGVPGTIAGLGLMGLGAILPGAAAQGAEAVRQDVTGKPTRGKEGELSTQMAIREQMLQQDLSALDRSLGVNLGYMRDLARDMSNQEYLNNQRNLPLINKLKNADLVRQQALINTQGQNYAMLGTLATAGRLATGAQAEAGATMRTALTSNPYAGSVMQAPQISFG